MYYLLFSGSFSLTFTSASHSCFWGHYFLFRVGPCPCYWKQFSPQQNRGWHGVPASLSGEKCELWIRVDEDTCIWGWLFRRRKNRSLQIHHLRVFRLHWCGCLGSLLQAVLKLRGHRISDFHVSYFEDSSTDCPGVALRRLRPWKHSVLHRSSSQATFANKKPRLGAASHRDVSGSFTHSAAHCDGRAHIQRLMKARCWLPNAL